MPGAGGSGRAGAQGAEPVGRGTQQRSLAGREPGVCQRRWALGQGLPQANRDMRVVPQSRSPHTHNVPQMPEACFKFVKNKAS